MTWSHAFSFISGVNGGVLDIKTCGYTGPDRDWRLPNVIEIESLVHAGLVDQSAP